MSFSHSDPYVSSALLALAEGGTNLAAMEAMAAGVPVIISNNTGHVDIAKSDHCFPLEPKRIRAAGDLDSQGWKDSYAQEVVQTLEDVHGDRDTALMKGKKAAEFIRKEYSWPAAVAGISRALQSAGF